MIQRKILPVCGTLLIISLAAGLTGETDPGIADPLSETTRVPLDGDGYRTIPSRDIDLQIQKEASNAVRLTWTADPQAVGYNLYSAERPLQPGDAGWGLPDFVTATSTWFYVSDPAHFYYVASIVASPPGLIAVSGGTFNPTPEYEVTLSSYLIDKYEVTQGSFENVMGWLPSNLNWGSGDDFPVYYVSWFNAIEYCNRRSLAEGKTPCYSYSTYGTEPDSWPDGWDSAWGNHINVQCDWDADGFRLPTEMEWMFAAMGGNQSLGYVYSGGDVLGTVGWYRDNSNLAHIGGLKQPNELGLYDMSGNEYEWCWDRYDFFNPGYPTGSATDPTGTEGGNERSLRGGAWGSYDYQCTVDYRFHGYANGAGQLCCFRVVRRP